MAPELSVIIPTHNRRAVLARCIAALVEQSQDPGSFEVVIADDGSEDGTIAMLGELQTPFALRALDLGKVGRTAARNAAIEASEGEITLMMDDDVIAGKGLLEAHIAAHRDHGMVVGIGKLDQATPSRRDWYMRAFAEGWNAHFDRLAEKDADWTDCYSGNMSAPRASLLAVGGFGPKAIVEDAELCYRLVEAGCVVRYLPDAGAVHEDQKSRRRLIATPSQQGAGQAGIAESVPAMRSKLLGWFGATTGREIMLRRTLLALEFPSGDRFARGLLPGKGRRGSGSSSSHATRSGPGSGAR